jgi:predicted GNAT family N-acyltransferase
VATGRLLPDGHVGRLAVLKPFRNKGLGRMVLGALEHEAKIMGMKKICLAAQKPAVGFYKRQGFVEIGVPFLEVGIEHINMEKRIKGDSE